MNTLTKSKIELNSDALDMRIDRLIAKYSNVCKADGKLQVHFKINNNNCTNDSKRNTFASYTILSDHETPSVHTYSIKRDHYFYKLQNSSDSDVKNGHCKQRAYHDIDYNSNSDTDSDLNLSTANYYRLKNCAVKRNLNFEDHVKHVNLQTSFTNENSKKSYAEKTTYCRPIPSSYDRNFVTKVMNKNDKLQTLLIKYIISRHREKEKEKWNNYVNNQSVRDWSKYSSPSVSGKPFNVPKVRKSCENCNQNNSPYPYHKIIYEPKIGDDDQNHPGAKYSKLHQRLKQIKSAGLYHVPVLDTKQSRDVQTHITFGACNISKKYMTNESDSELQTTDNETRAMIKDLNDVENMTKTTENHYAVVEPVYDLNKTSNADTTSIKVLENKLDTIINLFNSFVSNFQTKNMLSEKISTNTFVIGGSQHAANIATSITKENKNKISIVGNVMTNTSLCAIDSNLSLSHYLMNMRLNKIFNEELDKSNKIRSEILNMLKTNRPTNDLNIDIPTKERSTEVTDSLSKTKLECPSNGVIVEDISHRQTSRSRPLDRRIAVNTEPLGLLTLLRLSTEAVKQIVSFIPDISWYLSRVCRPVIGRNECVCNICGAAFARPSELGAHILRHDLGQTRNCSICRHTVDRQRPSQLFRCRHCGQLFTRAYCCELHQQCCGCSSRNTPSRALLR
ncbi:uncharacterized protein LOC134797933 [Cydia splendana]|uniref:uncharacterized protein LOC134797933 n=1 Tax=Cydia splendana TaxID=1100963 RepID=UPI00300CB150